MVLLEQQAELHILSIMECFACLQAYLQNTGARATAFQNLTTNDAAAARVIEQRMKKLVQMQVRPPARTLQPAVGINRLASM